jgi:hypothetical protein
MRRIVSAGAVVAAVALTAPGAAAGHVNATCRVTSLSSSVATGRSTYEGVAEGAVAGTPNESVSIRCVVKVNGAVRVATDRGSGSGVATTAGRVTFTASLTDVMQLCAQYTSAHGASERCFSLGFGDAVNLDVVADGVGDTLSSVEGGVPVGARAWCSRAWWEDGDSCTFDAPAGSFAFDGTADNRGEGARVEVQVWVANILLASCAASDSVVATCGDVVTSPFPSLPHTCVVRGSGGIKFQCADPPRLPLAP